MKMGRNGRLLLGP